MFTSRLPLITLFSSIILSTASPVPPLVRRVATVIADGRVPTDFALAGFDAKTSPFSPDFVRATDIPFSKILQFPNEKASLFDGTTSKSIEVTIDDQSIFAPGGNAQNGFRRAELLLASNDGKDATVQGITTMHFSIKDDPAKPLDFNHEYQPVFIETNDFASHVWTIKTGTAFGADPTGVSECEKKTLRLGSSTANGAAENVLFQTPFTSGVFHNFAIETDWDKSTITVFFSTGDSPLEQVVATTPNDSTGKGQAHFGVLKLPGQPSTNPSQDGVQEPGINEGLIYGGIFVEDSSTDGPTLTPP